MWKRIYKKIIDYLVKYYTGVTTFNIGKCYMSGPKVRFGIFILIWGLMKLFIQGIPEGMTWFAWWDFIMVILFIPQLLAAFSMFAVNEQKRLDNNENK